MAFREVDNYRKLHKIQTENKQNFKGPIATGVLVSHYRNTEPPRFLSFKDNQLRHGCAKINKWTQQKTHTVV